MSEFTASETPESIAPPPAGFSFENVKRNAAISASGSTGAYTQAKAMKTGTTIVGTIFKGGVVLGADTRATGDTTVCDKNCEKIHYMAPNIYCCGAGTAADTEKTTELIASQLELLRMSTKTQSRIVTACTLLKRMLFRYQGHVSAALVLGGCDINGPHVYQIYPHGSTGKLPYTTMGSGSLAAMSVFESEWKEDMTEDEAKGLVERAITAGIFNDLGSGSNCDTCVIRMDGSIQMNRGALNENPVEPLRDAIKRSDRFNFPRGTTAVLSTEFVAHKTKGLSLDDVDVVTMDTN